jgi:hypothetical protein
MNPSQRIDHLIADFTDWRGRVAHSSLLLAGAGQFNSRTKYFRRSLADLKIRRLTSVIKNRRR